MSVTNSYSRHAVVLDTDTEAGTPVILGATVELSAALQSQIERTPMTGEIYPRHIAIASIKPGAMLKTHALQDWLDQIGLTGKAIASSSQDGLEIYFQKFAANGGPASGSVHRSLTISSGLIVPRRLTVSHQGDAELTFDVLIIYDGTNDPIVVADNVALPSSPPDNERFTIGPVDIGGVTINHIRSVEIDFGINARTLGADSDIYDTRAEIRTINPTITMRGIDVTLLKSAGIPIGGLAATHANTAIYFRKRTQTGFVADATQEHIEVTAYGLAVIDDAAGQSGDENAETSFRLECAFDGTNTPIVIDTTAALP